MKDRSNPKLSAARDRLAAHQKAIEVAARLLDAAESPAATPTEQEYSIGQALYQLQEYAAASEHLTASFKLQESPETAARVAVCYWRMKNIDLAKEWIGRAIKLDPSGSITTLIAGTKPTFLAILAEIHLTAGELLEAAAVASGALNVDPHDVTALHVLATTQVATGDATGAVASSTERLRRHPPLSPTGSLASGNSPRASWPPTCGSSPSSPASRTSHGSCSRYRTH
jgi:tetratricopeptide (TPR) repeat protein